MGTAGDHEPTGHRDAVFGLCERDGALLLVEDRRLASGRPETFWDLPGGAVRRGEGLPDALRREWTEEVGLHAEVGDLLLVTDGAKRRQPGEAPLYTWRAFVYEVSCTGAPVAGRGIVSATWTPRAEAATRLAAPYHAPLRRLLAGPTPLYGAVDWIDPGPANAGNGATSDAFRRLLGIAASAAAGSTDGVRAEVAAALAAGEDPPRVAETLLQVVPYAGFPRTIAAFRAAGLSPGVAPEGVAGGTTKGRAAFDAVYGETSDRVHEGLEALDPHLAAWTLSFAYGTVLARDGLALRERELLAVAILTAMGGLADPLLGHMRAALRLGASVAHVRAAVEAVPQALGEGRRDAARALLDRLA